MIELRLQPGFVTKRDIQTEADVFSRLNRAAGFLPDRELDRYYIVDLEDNPEYQNLTTSVRSQIKKAINLKLNYLNEMI